MGRYALRLYVAASFKNRTGAAEVRDRLISEGVEVTSRWIDTHVTELEALNDEHKGKESIEDLRDIRKSGGMVFVNDPDIPSTSGGQHLEMGYALALNKPVFLIGPKTSVFHYHPGVAHVDTIDQLIEAIHVGQ